MSGKKQSKSSDLEKSMDNKKSNFRPKFCLQNGEIVVDTKYTVNENNLTVLTRKPSQLYNGDPLPHFCNLIRTVEEKNNLDISIMTKDAIKCEVLKFIENNRYLFYDVSGARIDPPNAEAKKKNHLTNIHRIYHVRISSIIELYIAVMLYPNLIEMTFNENYDLTFIDPFIQKSFIQVFRDYHDLINAIIYDSMIIAIDHAAQKLLKDFLKLNIVNDSSIDDNITSLENELKLKIENTKKSDKYDYRLELIKMYLPTIRFGIRYRLKKKSINDFGHKEPSIMRKCKYASDFLNVNFHDPISKMSASFQAMESEYPYFANDIMSAEFDVPIQKYICLYSFNKQCNLIDLNVMRTHKSFCPTLVGGLCTPLVLDRIMKRNTTLLNQFYDPKENAELIDKMVFYSLHCSRNYVKDNIKPKDIEFLNFLIERGSNTFYDYFFENMQPQNLYNAILGKPDFDNININDCNEDIIEQMKYIEDNYRETLCEPEWSEPFIDSAIPKSINIDTVDYRTIRDALEV